MRINTNIASVNTLRQLGKTNASLGKTFGRLSSGFRITSAGDDAAGLGIANALRADTRSLQQASRNAEQATSLLQTAEGAGQVVQGILERMKELATQAASDNTTSDGRDKINAEFIALRNEIDRVVDTTEFSGQTLLNGSLGAYVDTTASAALLGIAGVVDITASGLAAGTYTFTDNAGDLTLENSDASLTQTVSIAGATAQTLTFSAFGVTVETNTSYVADSLDGDLVIAGNSVSFMVSSSGDYTGQDLISLNSMDMRTTTLGIDGESLDTAALAQAALTAIDAAISAVNDVFGDIGAAQNRMEFSKHNVDTAVENFMAAESIIRDADMAFEVSQMTKFQILQQAGTAVLAQANTAPQSILTLLS
jgi:flagellin